MAEDNEMITIGADWIKEFLTSIPLKNGIQIKYEQLLYLHSGKQTKRDFVCWLYQ